ncbi:hypothetical protein [Halobellus captivus]|nr:hypothetical protein [Halobellus captivus]
MTILRGDGYRRTFERARRSADMSDRDLLAVILAAIAILMFATGLFLAT